MTADEFLVLCKSKLDRMIEFQEDRELWIWGCGVGGNLLSNVLGDRGIAYNGFIDRDASYIKRYMEHEVILPTLLNPKRQYVIVSLFNFNYSILKQLLNCGYTQKDCFFVVEHENLNKEEIIYKNCRIGRYTYGYEGLLSQFSCCSSIGSFCSINYSARVVANHPFQYISTNPFFYNPALVPWDSLDELMERIVKLRPAEYQPDSWWTIGDNSPCIIGNDVWIGANVIIMPKVRIGNGAILGAGTVVTKDVPDYAVVVGNPARIVKYRYSELQIEALNRIKWWDWSEGVLMDRLFDFYLPIDEFIEKYDVY